MRSQVASILLLFCLAAPCAWTYSWLQYQKYAVKKQVKKQMIAGLDKSELVFLAFSKNEAQRLLEWEHDREFEFRGQMFDVVEAEEKGDSVFYRCWLDHAETRLNKQLAQLASGLWENHPSKQEAQKRLLAFFDLLFCAAPLDWQLSAAHARHGEATGHSRHIPPGRLSSPPNPPPEGN